MEVYRGIWRSITVCEDIGEVAGNEAVAGNGAAAGNEAAGGELIPSELSHPGRYENCVSINNCGTPAYTRSAVGYVG